MIERLPFLPSVSDAMHWCREAGVSPSWGGRSLASSVSTPHPSPFHADSGALERVDQIVIHRSGFARANAATLRWYHRSVNAWPDIGYHYVIGNGASGWSPAGFIENGRPSDRVGAHVRGHNQHTLGICLIDNDDHFRQRPPHPVQAWAAILLLTYLLLEQSDQQSQTLGHSDLAPVRCPGAAVPVNRWRNLAQHRASSISSQSHERTLDLRHPFRRRSLDPRQPEAGSARLAEFGVTRVVYPMHWGTQPWECLKVARRWVHAAAAWGIATWLYTGPFGSEPRAFLKADERRLDWLQRDPLGEPVTLPNSGGHLYMCDPESPYLNEYRLPRIMTFLEATGAIGIFLDIPWLLHGAAPIQGAPVGIEAKVQLTAAESRVRRALAAALVTLRDRFECVQVAANVGAPSLWDVAQRGAGPLTLNGLCDEMVTEWTPRKLKSFSAIERSLQTVRVCSPGTRLSHAYNPRQAVQVGPGIDVQLEQNLERMEAGCWWLDLPATKCN